MEEETREEFMHRLCLEDAKKHADNFSYLHTIGSCHYCARRATHRVHYRVPHWLNPQEYTYDVCQTHAEVWADAVRANAEEKYGPQTEPWPVVDEPLFKEK